MMPGALIVTFGGSERIRQVGGSVSLNCSDTPQVENSCIGNLRSLSPTEPSTKFAAPNSVPKHGSSSRYAGVPDGRQSSTR